MALVNTAVPNLIQGVSQQSDPSRFSGQCDEQINALSSVVDGLSKRPHTSHVAKILTEAIATSSFVKFINRTPSEQYVVIHDGSKLRAFDLADGSEASINNTTGGYTTSGSYLETGDPTQDIKSISIADSTFLVNRNKVVIAKTTKTPARDLSGFVFVKQGDFKKEYGVRVKVIKGDETGVTTAVADVELEAYIVSTYRIGRVGTGYNYSYRIKSITLQDGGSGYTEAPTIQIVTAKQELEAPTFNITMSNGSISSLTLVSKGRYVGGSQNNTNFPPAPVATASFQTANSTSYETFFSFTTGTDTDAANAQSSAIIAGLLNQATTSGTNTNITNLRNDFTISSNDNALKLDATNTDITNFELTTFDDLADTGMQAVYESVGAIGDLPKKCYNNFEIEVTGSDEIDADNYYVKFLTNNGQFYGEGVWVETVAPNILEGIDNTSMPMLLRNTAVKEFELVHMSVADRLVGDDDSNPLPSFRNRQIANVFFHKNRLGLLADEHVIMSESGFGEEDDEGRVIYNFGSTTVRQVIDSDPIDVSISSSKITKLKSSAGFQENLVLFTDNTQFVLKGADILSPSTVSINAITNFENDENVDPLPLGSYIYFAFPRNNFSGVREFIVNATSDTYDASEITEHVPLYLPDNLKFMIGSSTEDMVFALSEDTPDTLYVYKYFWSGQRKLLSSWSKFKVTGNIIGADFLGSLLYLVVTNEGETHILKMQLESGNVDDAGYNTYLDYRIEADITAGDATINLPYKVGSNAVVEVYTKDGYELKSTHHNDAVTLVDTPTESQTVWVGISYTMSYTFSELIFKAASGDQQAPSNFASMYLRNGALFFNKTGAFNVKVTPEFRDENTNEFTTNVVGQSTLGTLDIKEGSFRFPIMANAKGCKIVLENSTALPSFVQSAEFEANVHTRSRRYG